MTREEIKRELNESVRQLDDLERRAREGLAQLEDMEAELKAGNVVLQRQLDAEQLEHGCEFPVEFERSVPHAACAGAGCAECTEGKTKVTERATVTVPHGTKPGAKLRFGAGGVLYVRRKPPSAWAQLMPVLGVILGCAALVGGLFLMSELSRSTLGEPCKKSEECRSEKCLMLGGGFGVCSKSCSADADCGAGMRCATGVYEDSWQEVLLPEQRSDYVRVCAPARK